MSGFLIFLCILAGIIFLIVGILSIPVRVSFTYSDKIYLTVKYLFIKLNILPVSDKKKDKKPKPEKEEKPKEDIEETPKEKKPNPILNMLKANGYDGMMEVLKNLGQVMGKYGGKLFKSVVFDEIDIYADIGTGDSARTALKYGETCQIVYPLVGFICSNNVVKKYDINIEPDFLANNSDGEFHLDFHLIIRKITNATIAMAVRLLFKVVLKFLKGAKNKSPENIKTEIAESVLSQQAEEKAK